MRLLTSAGIAALAVILSLVFLSSLVLSIVSPVARFAFGRSRNLVLSMKTNQFAVRMSGSIDVTLTLANLGTEEVELHYSTSHNVDLFLYSLDGKLVAYLTKGCGFLQVLTNIRLAPSESREWRLSWSEFGETGVTVAGLYLLEGSVSYFGTCKLPILILP